MKKNILNEFLPLTSALTVLSSCGGAPISEKISDTTVLTRSMVNIITEEQCIKSDLKRASRPIFAKVNGQAKIGCLSYEFDDLAQLERGCNNLYLADSPEVYFVLDAPFYYSASQKNDPPRWICRPVSNKNDEVGPALNCSGKWFFISKGKIDYKTQKEYGEIMVPICLVNEYASMTHFVLSNCSNLAQNTKVPLGAVIMDGKSVILDMKVAPSKDDTNRSSLYFDCPK